MQLPQNYEAKFPDSRQSAGFQILDSLLSLNRKIASIPVNIGFECTCSDVLIRMADACCRSLCNKITSLSSGCFTSYNCHQKLTVKGRVAYRFREIITLVFLVEKFRTVCKPFCHLFVYFATSFRYILCAMDLLILIRGLWDMPNVASLAWRRQLW